MRPSPFVVLRVLLVTLLGAFAIGTLATAQSVKTVARAPAPVFANGLIVRLKDAPTHETAQSLGTARASVERAMSVAKSAGVEGVSKTRPVGRDAQLLEFGRLLDATETAQLIAKMKARPEVAWVGANTREHRLQAVPNDPFYGQQWWLQPVSGSNANEISARLRGVPGFQSAWATTQGTAAAVVAVLDTGITAHPDIAGHVLPGYDFVFDPVYANDGDGQDADPSDPGDWVSADDQQDTAHFPASSCPVESSSWHGTEIAGVIGAATNNGLGVAGINWNAQILPVRVAGKCGADVADIIDGMRWAAGFHVAGAPDNPVANWARVINISFGAALDCDANSSLYQETVDELASVGVVVVAAAGNESAGALTRPANCRGVIAVGAVNRDGFKATYSNFGGGVTLMAPGGDPDNEGRWGALLGDTGVLTLDNIGTTTPDTGAEYAFVFGSSFSAPITSGAISLMLSVNPNLTVPQIIAGLQASARPHVTAPKIGACSAANPGRCICTTATCGAGLLDAAEAVRYAQVVQAGQVYTPPNWATVVLDNADIDNAVALGQDLDGAVTPPPAQSDDGGGGALGAGWLAALAAAVLAARLTRRRPG